MLRKKTKPNISAPHAILIDAENGSVLFERDADQLIFPASLAKLMTAEYVFNELKAGRLKLTDEFMVSENAWRKGGAPSHGSTMFAAIYSKVPVDDLIAWHDHPVGQRCLHRAGGRALPGTRLNLLPS